MRKLTHEKKKFSGIPAEEFIAYASNHTCKEIAEHFDRHSTNVYSVLSKNSIPYKKIYSRKVGRKSEFAPEDRRLLHDMIKTLAKTYSQNDIARILGCSQSWVSNICNAEIAKED